MVDDEGMRFDLVEGETGLIEAIDAVIERMIEVEGFSDSIDATIKKLRERKERFERQSDHIRAMLQHALTVAELRKLERPAATVSLRKVAPNLVVLEESQIPSEYFVTGEPKLDRRRLAEDVKAGASVPGTTLSNGGETISVRLK